MRGPVGPERVRVRQPIGHASGLPVTTHEPMHGHGGEGEMLLVAVAAEAHKQGLLIEHPDAASERVGGPPPTPRAPAGRPQPQGPRARGRPCRARRADGGEHWTADGAGPAPAGCAVRPRVARNPRAHATGHSRACPRSCAGRRPAEGSHSRCRSASPAARARGGAPARPRPPRPGRGPARTDHRQIHAHRRRRRRAAARGQVPRP